MNIICLLLLRRYTNSGSKEKTGQRAERETTSKIGRETSSQTLYPKNDNVAAFEPAGQYFKQREIHNCRFGLLLSGISIPVFLFFMFI